MYRQEKVNLAHRKLRQKGQTLAKSAENSSCTRKLDASSPELENMRFSNHRYMGKVFQCLQKKAATHLGPDFPVNSEIYKNTRFENVENVFNITQKINQRPFRRNSECERLIHHHHGRDRYWSTIKRANGRRQKFASTLTPFYVLVGWNRVHEEQNEDGTAKLKISGCIHHIKMLWESMEKQLN